MSTHFFTLLDRKWHNPFWLVDYQRMPLLLRSLNALFICQNENVKEYSLSNCSHPSYFLMNEQQNVHTRMCTVLCPKHRIIYKSSPDKTLHIKMTSEGGEKVLRACE